MGIMDRIQISWRMVLGLVLSQKSLSNLVNHLIIRDY
jgi:hypothetical protein